MDDVSLEEPERKTSVGIQFQYKAANSVRPLDERQAEDLHFVVPYGTPIATVPIPAVGDTVSLVSLTDEDERRRAYKVLTRHFSYTESSAGLYVFVNIVVTDTEQAEMLARLKE